MVKLIAITVVLFTAFIWSLYLNSKNKKLLKAAEAEADKLDISFIPAKREEENLKHRKIQYGSLQNEYKTNLAKLKKNESRLSQFNIGVGTTDLAMYRKITGSKTIEQIERELEDVKFDIKQSVSNKTACVCNLMGEYTINGKKGEANKFFRREIKLRLRCLDNEFKAASALADWNNINRLTDRVCAAYKEINDRGDIVETFIKDFYLKLKITELKLNYELSLAKQEFKEAEREEASIIREAEREEKRIKVAAEKAEKERKLMEVLIAKELSKLESLTQEQKDLFELHKKQLESLKDKEQRAQSLAQLTRAGYVYVISNTMSFGEGIVKIGMTRRADPNDRVKELGDASVPELFHVHAFAFTEDAPALEKHLHKKFAEQRVNLVNGRKEFFFAEPNTVLTHFDSYDGQYEFSELSA
jgi:hypothetical protein